MKDHKKYRHETFELVIPKFLRQIRPASKANEFAGLHLPAPPVRPPAANYRISQFAHVQTYTELPLRFFAQLMEYILRAGLFRRAANNHRRFEGTQPSDAFVP
jgi:hypothetical protein